MITAGTPKVFLPLEAGREMFGNRWGEFTALRVPRRWRRGGDRAALVLAAMTPAAGGLVLRDLRERGDGGGGVAGGFRAVCF